MPDVIREPRVKVFAQPPWDTLDPAELRLVMLYLAPMRTAREIEERLGVSQCTRWRMEARVVTKIGVADLREAVRNADADGLPAER